MGDQSTLETQTLMIGALSTLSTTQLSSLSLSLFTTFHHHHHRLASLLSSPTLFSHTLNHLFSLSLPHKSLLIARYLLSFLHLLLPFFPSLSPSSSSSRLRLCDLDSVLLLLFFCEVRQHSPRVLETTSPRNWLGILQEYGSDTMLKLSGLTVTPAELLGSLVDIVVKCRRFVATKACLGGDPGKEVPASVAVVVALPSVEVGSGGGIECVICKEEMRQGRDVCELPCHHLFHWMCVLPWLRKRNTCPCCRFRLPTDDVYGEIQRCWEAIAKTGGHHFDYSNYVI